MEILETIRTRRSVRHYQDVPVADSDLKIILEAARMAPSWKNTQCWRFIVVRDNEVKAELAEAMGDNTATEAVGGAPVVIVVCAELGKSGYIDDKVATEKGEYWFMFDVALAMQNLVLAAHSLGLGTVIVGSFDAGRVAAALGVPPGFAVVTMTPLGYPEYQPKPRPRKEPSEIIFHEKFGVS
ncbi:MAG: nitroreductase family protein [Candidatus Diapherotrites archaeon]|nr:nitroreductase family protein [Candidatus Diapherotrites archaeon]